MPTYYEVLKLDSNATVQVIEAAIDEQYNQYRRLVNHHDPNVVEQANRALRQLEEIRSALTNLDRRADYDRRFNIGGLIDPSADVGAASPSTPTSKPMLQPTENQDDPRVYPWKCNRCHTANLLGSKTCSNCGTIIARDCPNGCGNVVRLQENYCSKCGYSVEERLAKMQLVFEQAQERNCSRLRAEILAKDNQISRLQGFQQHMPVFASAELNQLTGKPVATLIDLAGSLLLALLPMTACSWFFLDRLDYDPEAPSGLLFALGLGIVGVLLFLGVLRTTRKTYHTVIGEAVIRHKECLRHTGHQLQEEQSRHFDPLSPKPYSPEQGSLD